MRGFTGIASSGICWRFWRRQWNNRNYTISFIEWVWSTDRGCLDFHFFSLNSQNDAKAFDDDQEMKQWSPDGKSYIAAKIIPGFGTLIYMACTSQPELGWDERGFADFSGLDDVPNVADLFKNVPLRDPVLPPPGANAVPPQAQPNAQAQPAPQGKPAPKQGG
jgi:hypothetical protein